MVQTLWDSITEFLSPEAGQRRREALDEFGRDVGYYVPPEMRGLLGFTAEMTPSATIDRAAQAGGEMLAPGRTPMQRLGSAGEMLSETAGVAAPMAVATRAGMPVAQAVQEGLLGVSMAADDVGRRVIERANQPGPVPTMYSNPMGRAADDAPQGIRAYHGSPHDFERFSMEKIGTGEGAQAYGHGLYFAENERVARGYRDALSGNRMDSAVFTLDDGVSLDPSTSSILRKNNGDIDAAISELRSRAENSPLASVRSQASERVAFLEANRDRISFNPSGSMYEVNIAANPEDFLDWDKPLSEQSQSVLDAITPMVQKRLDDLEAAGQRGRMIASEKGLPDFTPKSREQLYQEMRGGDIIGASRLGQFDEAVEDIFSDAGVPGIQYLDQGSRGAGNGTRNYVVFDENLINIVRKYGIAGAAAMLGMTVAELQSQMGQAQAEPQGLLE